MLPAKIIKNFLKEIKRTAQQYYYLDFDMNGLKNWNDYLRFCLPDVKGKRILDLESDTGIYDLEIAKMGAREIIGISKYIKQALKVKELFSKELRIDFNNIKFFDAEIHKRGLGGLDNFDFAALFYGGRRFYGKIDFVMKEVSKVTDTVVMQDSINRFKHIHNKNRLNAAIDRMRKILTSHGFNKIHIFSIDNYPKPVIIGKKH